MAHSWKIALTLAASVALIGGVASAQPDHGRPGGGDHAAPSHAAPPHAESHAGPRGYVRPAPPTGWNARPAAADRGAYQHNFQAARTYQIGPYHAPHGGAARRWAYGQTLPRAYWSSQYILGDYWLFGLEVPPVGFEWVRYGTDALLIDLNTGSILQVEYGVFG